jgi:hypothetical protein
VHALLPIMPGPLGVAIIPKLPLQLRRDAWRSAFLIYISSVL